MPLLEAFPNKDSLQRTVSGVSGSGDGVACGLRAAWEIKMATIMFCSLDFDGVMHQVLLYVLGRH
jgi:hypothetical protein